MTLATTQGHGALGARPMTPRIVLTTATFTINRGDTLSPRYEDQELPVLLLSFDYDGVVVPAQDDDLLGLEGLSLPSLAATPRSAASERRARLALEALGAVDLACLEDYGQDPQRPADYLVSLSEDPSVYCAFTEQALPALRAQGFEVEIAEGYPYRLVQSERLSWYSDLDSPDERPGWFQLELGVELDGRRIDLVAVLLKLLEEGGDLPSLRAMRRRPDSFVAVPVADAGYVKVSPERLEQLFEVLVELYDGELQKRPAFGPDRLSALSLLPEELDLRDKVRGDLELPEWNPDFLASATPILQDDLRVKATLRPYQLEGVAFLQHLTNHDVGGILADDMGLGKTLQTIAHLSLEHKGPLVPPSLIVCPTSLVGNWRRELLRFAPQLRVAVHHGRLRQKGQEQLDGADVIITSYPILLRDEEVFAELEVHLLILDEAQAIKSAGSSYHAAVSTLKARHRLCLTGTPIENHLGELWSLFDFVMPGWLGGEAAFRARYRHSAQASLADRARLEALHHRVAPYILRRTKEEVARDLPPKLRTVVPIELTGKQRELYESIRSAAHDEVRRTIRSKGISGATLQVLDALTKLRQVCCDPRLVQMEAARFVRQSAKLERLLSLLSTHLECGRRVLVFSQFTSMLALIEQALAERDIDSLLLTGQTEQRDKRVAAFEHGQADVFLISLKAGGTGLNLTSADTVIHYDPWWNPAAQDQATDRAYRIGQKRSVLVQELVVAGSVEERMRALQARKRELAKAVLEGEGSAEPLLTERAVDDLFAPIDG